MKKFQSLTAALGIVALAACTQTAETPPPAAAVAAQPQATSGAIASLSQIAGTWSGFWGSSRVTFRFDPDGTLEANTAAGNVKSKGELRGGKYVIQSAQGDAELALRDGKLVGAGRFGPADGPITLSRQ